MNTDVIVVLGCSVVAGAPSAALQRRVAMAARAFREGVADRVIASGGRRWNDHVEAEVIRRALRDEGVDHDAITLDLCSLTTRGNGYYSAKLMDRMGARSAFLATCAWHIPRARASFERHGITVVAPPAAWDNTPPPSITTRLRESFWRLFG